MRITGYFISIVVTACFLADITYAEEIRDYYAEPGLHPFKDPVSDLNETIDPFSGTLQLRHSDITVPGNGGLDITVTRFYTSHQDGLGGAPSYNSIYGIGWTMHFGRIVVPQAHAAKICSQQTWSVTTADNPSIEHPDGARELLVLADDGSGDLITKSNWRAKCVIGQDGLLVLSPDGTQYRMDTVQTVALAENLETSWYTSEITDVVGNSIQITYQQHPSGYLHIDEVTGHDTAGGNDGRLVKFFYDTDTNGCFKLREITSNNQTWSYTYASLLNYDPGYTFCGYNLTAVNMPTGLSWQYEYYPKDHPAPGKYSVKKVTYPYGGIYDYTYQHVRFDVAGPDPTLTTAVQTKNTSGPNITPGTWTYSFAPGSRTVPAGAGTVDADVTTVTQPNGATVYVHQGVTATGFQNLWAMGLLLGTEIYTPGGVLIEQTVPSWDKRQISLENYWHGRNLQLDTETHAPISTSSQTWRNGSTHSTLMSNHDQYGNPQRIEETTIIGGQPNKITNLTYYNDAVKWIIGKTEDETIEGIGIIDRTYNTLGQVISEDKYGVTTIFTYTPEGDVNTITDARNNVITKQNYFRGIPRTEIHPEAVTIIRTVNPTGTVASLTNGRGFIKHFSYDTLNRLTGIDFPINADVTINWTATGKTLTRGNYQEAVTFDGYGKEVQIARTDTVSTETITKTTNYDALGQKVFESYPNSAQGITFSYDVLGRLERLDHPDGAFRSYAFGVGGIVVTETDERSNQTEYLYRAYGHPDNAKVPVNIESPENVCTIIQYNLLNQVTLVHQGERDAVDGLCYGFARNYGYNTNYFLTSEINPETGTTTFGRDAIGNMTSRQVDTSAITSFSYDGRNRLTFTDYPATTPDVTRAYDKNDNIRRVDNADSQHEFIYDENDNLDAEIIAIGASTYTVDYTYDPNDIIKTLNYPSGRLIDYSADAFGRPTQITPYVNNIDYYPSGQIQQITYANGQITDITLNNRLWIERMHAQGVTEAMDLTYLYDSIGNVETITDALDPLNSRILSYDGINRLNTADGIWGTGTFSYDHQGNLTQKNVGSDTIAYSYNAQQLTFYNQNGFDNYVDYDVYGNIDHVETVNPLFLQVVEDKRYIYDDAGNLRTANLTQVQSPTSHSYGYDGNGMRVSRTQGSEQTEFVYAKNGNLLGEYDPDAAPLFGKEFIYLGSQLIANAQENQLPIADAGPDSSVFSTETAILDGTGSSDPDGMIVTYAWLQQTGTPVTLNNADSATASFTAPIVAADETLTFTLTVTDDTGETAADAVAVLVKANTPPVANAGLDQTVIGGELVSLDGTGSTDAEGSITYLWTRVAGPFVSLAGSNTATPSFTAPVNGTNYTLTFQLTVTDNVGVTDTDTVDVNVLDPNLDTDADGLADAWEIINFGNITSYTGNDDPDGDGITNQQEFEEDTDPNTPEPAPSMITGVMAISGDGENTIAWDNTVSVLAYHLYWSTEPGVTKLNGTKIADVTSPYTHTGLTNGTTYYYVITAANNAGESLDSAQVFAQPNTKTWNTPNLELGGVPPQASSINDNGDRIFARMTYTGTSTGNSTILARLYHDGQWGGETIITQIGNIGQVSLSEPQVAIDSEGNAMVVWRQWDGTRWNLWSRYYPVTTGFWGSIVRVEFYNGSSSIPGLTGDIHSFSNVAFDSQGRAFVTWIQQVRQTYGDGNSANGDTVYANIYTPGSGWGGRHHIGTNLAGIVFIDKLPPSLAISSSGRAVATWNRCTDQDQFNESIRLWNRCNDIWVNQYLPGSGWQIPAIIDNGAAVSEDLDEDNHDYDSQVAINAIGDAVVVWRRMGGSKNTIGQAWANRYVATTDTWGPAEKLATVRRNSAVQPIVALNDTGDAVAVWDGGDDIFGIYAPAGGSWGRAKAVNDTHISSGTADAPQVVIDTKGNAIVTLIQNEPGFYPDTVINRTDIVANRYVKQNGAWGDPVFLSDRALGNALDDYQLHLDGFDNALVVFGQYQVDWLGARDIYTIRYAVPPPANLPPAAKAGPNRIETSATLVTLDGSGSNDPEGNLVSYQWMQTGGPAVVLSNANTAIATFTAPSVIQDTLLIFELTVIDDVAQSDTDELLITVCPASGCTDVTPPITTGTFTRSTSKGIAYYDITLNSNEPGTTFFQLTGDATILSGGSNSTAIQVYSGPINIQMTKGGNGATFDYYSVDAVGNEEAIQTEVLQ